ncbi:MAG: hypothetical protein A3C35_08080 [Omnitrophica bacterium RIFCSPHIGHO2_02_FULL_46_11]|nr:MAG: hypothetical protein A3A81_02065 [Omnitrophica bacterium RIFCSPLOWO2_01_FULL_45_10b]OGW86511.1 MAG: hypothetical protein A3C35_08080 [Omnitrophica bacterium RIFCSPHIGHO2_02_FULL_46_11]
MIQNGKEVSLHYELIVDGETIDSTKGREPFQYTHGKQQIIPALEIHLEGLDQGDEREIVLGPEDAYGIVDPNAFIEVPISQMPQIDLEIGTQLGIIGPDGAQVPATIVELKEETVILNLNHPLAGKELRFLIQIIEVK